MKRAKELFVIHIVDMASKDLYDSKYNRIEAIKQTTFFVVTQSFTLSSDLQTTKSSTQFLRIYTYLNMVS